MSQNDRVTMGVLLVDIELGMAGAVGKHNTESDTWVLTMEIERDLASHLMLGGHEMIITGYDDNAIAVDEAGHEHKGLFTLCNSWGDKVGDQGDFYMSYDYFRVLALEAYRITSLD